MYIGALIVDDEEDIRTLVRLVIDAANKGLFVAGEAADGGQALDKLDDIDPSVVVLDERMPGLTGVETAMQMLERRPGQIIILCSAYLDAGLQQRAEAAGIKVCLAKGDYKRIPEVLREVTSASA